jgi:hypothetical protein
MSEQTAIICTAPACLEDSREIPEIGSTGMRKGKRTLVNGVDQGWTHLDCEPGNGSIEVPPS